MDDLIRYAAGWALVFAILNATFGGRWALDAWADRCDDHVAPLRRTALTSLVDAAVGLWWLYPTTPTPTWALVLYVTVVTARTLLLASAVVGYYSALRDSIHDGDAQPPAPRVDIPPPPL